MGCGGVGGRGCGITRERGLLPWPFEGKWGRGVGVGVGVGVGGEGPGPLCCCTKQKTDKLKLI